MNVTWQEEKQDSMEFRNEASFIPILMVIFTRQTIIRQYHLLARYNIYAGSSIAT